MFNKELSYPGLWLYACRLQNSPKPDRYESRTLWWKIIGMTFQIPSLVNTSLFCTSGYKWDKRGQISALRESACDRERLFTVYFSFSLPFLSLFHLAGSVCRGDWDKCQTGSIHLTSFSGQPQADMYPDYALSVDTAAEDVWVLHV